MIAGDYCVILTCIKPGINPESVDESWASAIVSSVRSWRALGAPLVTVVANRAVASVIKERVGDDISVIETGGVPMGALATAMLGAGYNLPSEVPVVVCPGDTKIFESSRDALSGFLSSEDDAGLLYFTCKNIAGNWSYLHVDKSTGDLLQITERQQATPLHTSGIFLFRDVRLLLEAGRWCFLNHVDHLGTFFTSGAINYFLAMGSKVYIAEVPMEGFHKQRGVT